MSAFAMDGLREECDYGADESRQSIFNKEWLIFIRVYHLMFRIVCIGQGNPLFAFVAARKTDVLLTIPVDYVTSVVQSDRRCGDGARVGFACLIAKPCSLLYEERDWAIRAYARCSQVLDFLARSEVLRTWIFHGS
jgi:hypothetical protein